MTIMDTNGANCMKNVAQIKFSLNLEGVTASTCRQLSSQQGIII